MKKKVLILFGEKDLHTKKLVQNLEKKTILKVHHFKKKKECKKIFKVKNFYFDFIFSYRSKYILSSSDIKKSKNPPINFHPGTPRYRGFGCVNYALYNNSKYYGVTTHIIDRKIDNGSIIGVKKFKISKKDNLSSLLKKTHKKLFFEAKKIINLLLDKPNIIKKLIKDNKKIKWSKIIKSKKDLDNFYKISKNINSNELNRVIKATVYKEFKPFVVFHSKNFYLE